MTTLDIIDGTKAVTRAVAIDENYQGKGHGKILGEMVKEFARAQGIEVLCVNADPDKTEYYSSFGFKPENWDMTEWDNIANPHVVQMTCKLN